jgi:hypothetical protein
MSSRLKASSSADAAPPVLHPVKPRAVASASALPAGERGAGAPAPPSFSGTLSAFAVPDLLEFLRGGRRSGVFVCESPAGRAVLRFRDGFIVSAACPGAPRLGQILARTRKLSPRDVEQLAARQAAEPGRPPLGELLVRTGMVDAPAVEDAVMRQIEHAIRKLVDWEDGGFSFSRDDAEAPPILISVSVNPQASLLEVFRQLDEEARDAAAGPTPQAT